MLCNAVIFPALQSAIGHVALAQLPVPAVDSASAALFNVCTGDGKAADTPAINKAIEAVPAAGGGTLAFPVGTNACFTVRFSVPSHSNHRLL
jgi:polygalacturonase